MVGGMLITGVDQPPLHHAAVLIDGNRIVQVGNMESVKFHRTPLSSTPAVKPCCRA
jgi:hypothetical protein